ncbi:glycosyltransferase family 4 protein [candidate division WOR-3 bacterium]|nr:glycosyltransferase family 4 protein [candidate division WOR-3 bacterium]
MRVLFVVTSYPRFVGDVITPWLVELIRRLKSRGVDISVFTSSYRGLGNQVIAGVRVFRFRYFLKRFERLTHEETAVDRMTRGPINFLLPLFYLAFGCRAIARLTKHEKFDIVHVHWPFPHVLFGVLGKRFGQARLYSSFYGVEVRLLKKKMAVLRRPFSALVNKSDRVTAISNHTAEELCGIVRKPVEIIPFSAAADGRAGKTSDKHEILFVGRLVSRKGVRYLLEGFHLIHKSVPHRLVIIGSGQQRGQLEAMAVELGIADRVVFTGMVSDEDLNRYYRSCSFLVLPAVYDEKGDTEGLGVVLLEAMSCGKPVIASGVGGITDIVVDQRNGLLVPPADADALARAIMTLVKNDRLRREMGRAARKTVDEKFNWDKIVGDMLRLYGYSNGSK